MKTQIQVDIDNIATDLNNKLDRDLSNVVGDAVERVVEQGDNYIRYSSGLQICWGTATGDSTVTYPKPFIAKPSVQVSGYQNENSGISASVKNDTLTSFYFVLFYNNGNWAGTSGAGFYCAIGRWK